MRFETAEIDRYGPLRDCRPPCDDDITIIAGPNESGKTLYLEAVLQLLEEEITDHMDSGPRVTQSPTGRIVLNDGSEQHVVGDGTALSDISRIEPTHLYNLFIIRDSDLALPDGSDYYTSLVEHLGDIHTSEIKAIRDELRDQGRLTDSYLNLMDRAHNTKTVRNDAASLADEIETYHETVIEQGISESIRERIQTRRELSTVEEQLAVQRTAEEVKNIEETEAQLDEYRTATRSIQDLSEFTRDTLDDLRDVHRDLDHEETRISDLNTSLEDKQSEVNRYREQLDDARDKLTALQQRESDVQRAESALETYRDQVDETGGERDSQNLSSKLAQRRYLTIGGLLGAGIASGGGVVAGSIPVIAIGVVLLLIAIGAAYSHRRLTGRLDDLERHKRTLLETARDAGFDVESPQDVGPRIEEFQNELNAIEDRVTNLEAQLEQATNRVEELESELETAVSKQESLNEELTSTLDEAGVDSIDEYDDRVEQKQTQDTRRSEAATVLTRELGDPDADAAEGKITYWDSQLAEWKSDIGEPDVDASQYDEDELDRLETRHAELDSKLDELETELTEFNEKLDEFERRANELTPPPFIDLNPSLQARTADGLQDLGEEVSTLVARIDANADVSRKAIEILDDINEDEQQKVATLFDPDGPASRVLSHLTNGRYTTVDFDPAAETLEVKTDNGQTLTPRQLSRGTRDQLYFAARLSLAQQLLGGESGFLLLDDPFLAADATRLQNGFETLRQLTDDGWQIVYLTAKPEVHDTMAEEFGCDVYELTQLTH